MASEDLTIDYLVYKLSSHTKSLSEECGNPAVVRPALSEQFLLASYWEDVSVTTKKLAQHCTQLCMILIKPPAPNPNEISSILRPMEECVDQIVMLVRVLPAPCGKQLSENMNIVSGRLLGSVMDLLEIVDGHTTPALVTEYTRLTRQVLDDCRELQTLPRTNTLTVAGTLSFEAEIIRDYYRRIPKHLMRDGGGEEDEDSDPYWIEWSPQDIARMKIFVRVVKLVRLLYKRTLEILKQRSEEPNAELCSASNRRQWAAADKLAASTSDMYELVFELVDSLGFNNLDDLLRDGNPVLDACEGIFAALRAPGLATEESLETVDGLSLALSHIRQQINTPAEQ